MAEQRLLLLAIVEARRSGKGLAEGNLLTVHAKDYAKQYKTDIYTAYKVLKDGADALTTKFIKYKAKSPMTGRLIEFREPWANKQGHVINDVERLYEFSQMARIPTHHLALARVRYFWSTLV